jgi:hypothetical protein
LKNDPDQTLLPRRQGRPKTKPDPDAAIQPRKRRGPKTKPQTITRKKLLSQAKDYNLKLYNKLNKQQLLSVLSKIKKLFFEKHDLQQLNLAQLRNVAKENNIKVNLRK